MLEIVNVGAVPGGEAFLLLTEGKNALVDTGFAFCVDKTVENIERHLNGKSLDYILLTHSHYDHASGTPFIRARWPEVKVVASEYASKVFSKSSALKVMNQMNDSAAKQWGYSDYPIIPRGIDVDVVVKKDGIIDLGKISFQVMEVPGHTRCSIAFYSREENLLLASETFGVPGDDFEYVVPCNLVGYQMTIDSIKFASSFGAERVLVPHYGVVKGEMSGRYFSLSLESVVKSKDMIVDGYNNGMNVEELVEIFKRAYFTDTLRRYQPESAFMLNANYMILMILRECLGVEVKI